MQKVLKLLVLVFFSAFELTYFSCKKNAEIPTLTTNGVSTITTTSAETGGNVTSSGGEVVTARGVCWSTSMGPTIADNKTMDGTGSGTFSSNITGLTAGTTYHVRAYATNSAGTAYGNEQSFTSSLIQLAVVRTSATSLITSIYALSGGNITFDGDTEVTSWGICWSTSQSPTTNDDSYNMTGETGGIGIFTCALTGLKPGTTYYVRAYAVNIKGIAYGDQISFITTLTDDKIITFNNNLTYGSVSDIDGNQYKTIQIGIQTWMAENLRTTKLNDGVAIQLAEDNNAWNTLSTPGYCWYSDDAFPYKQVYGALYNRFAVNSGKLCPAGWSFPDQTSYNNLVSQLGGASVAGSKLKEIGTSNWTSPNVGATNESGWTGLPGGSRLYDGAFEGLGLKGYWGYANVITSVYTDYVNLDHDQYLITFPEYWDQIASGISVRCIKNN